MERFTNSINASIGSGNWLAALFLALALPDICGALEAPTRPVGERYKDWFDRYLRPAYNPNSIYEMIVATSPDLLATLPNEAIASMKTSAAPAAFTADDCYRLRCRCLHQGLPERMGDDRIHFTIPDRQGRIRIHRNSFNGVLQLSIDEFCKDVAKAVMRWWRDVQNNPDVVSRARELIKIYGLDDSELPIVHYGKPQI